MRALRVVGWCLVWVCGALSMGGCVEPQVGAQLGWPQDACAATARTTRPAAPEVARTPAPPPARVALAPDDGPPMNLGFSRYVPPPLPWRRHSISLGYIGDWPLQGGSTPEYTYATRPFSCGNACDPDFILP